jgi:hypothetical protein
MGLGLPLALLALLGIGIPLWLHRVRRRSLRDLPLPTIALLSRAVVQKRRTLSFVDRPLLYARVALAALAAFALARPYVSRLASYATERPIALAILLDDSMSMQRRAARGGSLFEVGQGRASRVLAELAPESEATLVLAGNTPRLLSGRTTALASLRDRLSALERSGARGTALGEGLALALRELTTSKLAMREVLVLTDCAAHADADTLTSEAANIRVECIAARNAQPNAYIADMTLTRGGEVNAPHTLQLALVAGSQQAELEISLHADGRAIGEHSAALSNGHGSAEISIDPALLREAHTLTARIETPNAIAEDDVRELLLIDRAELSLLLVDGDPAPNQLDDELRYAAVALSLDNGERSLPRVTRIDADGLSSADLDAYDVMVLANVRAPAAEVAERITRYVARGGGLLIAAGDHVDAFAYRGSMGSLLPAVVRSNAPSSPPLALKKAGDVDSVLVPDLGRGLETGGTSKRLLLEPTSSPSQTLLSFSDGGALLVAGPHGQGTVALWTTTLDDDWSDLPLTPGFLPLLTGLVRGLAAVDALPPGPHLAGAVLSTRVPVGVSALYLVTPDGRRVDLDIGPRQRGNATQATRGDAQLQISDTAVSGVYRAFAVLDGQREHELEQLSFVVVPDTRDSDLSLRPPKQRDPEQRATTSAAHARGFEGWLWLLFGVAAIAEGALRILAKRREPQQAGAAQAAL